METWEKVLTATIFLFVILIAFAVAIDITTANREAWTDTGIVKTAEAYFTGSWGYNYTIQSFHHGLLRMRTGPSGNMSSAVGFVGCLGYNIKLDLNETVGIIYDHTCGYQIARQGVRS